MERRSAGILCPVFSLPGSYGIGQLGKAAYDFINYLSDSGFSHWQVLPLNPVDMENSPYSSSSAFAGYWAYIDLEELCNWGLLQKNEIPITDIDSTNEVAYRKAESIVLNTLKLAFKHFYIRAKKPLLEEYDLFLAKHKEWLDAYSIFTSLKKAFSHQSWNKWPEKFKDYKKLKKKHLKSFEEAIEFEKFIQFLFFKQWEAVKQYANSRGVSIIGDMPIYVNYDSADVWSNAHLFQLDEDLEKKEVAGVPPDFFAQDGQLWGFPIYNWEAHKKSKFQWWSKRTGHLLEIFDQLRFDHFRGIEAYWAVPGKDTNARNGKWLKAPGKELLNKVCSLKKNALLAENLGDISEEVENLRKEFNIPGMKILQFGFGGHHHSEHLPHNCDVNDIYYSGTHDNDVLGSWLKSCGEAATNHLLAYYGIQKEQLSTRWLVDRILASSPHLIILPLQDLMEVGEGTRINIPGTTEKNWIWRFTFKDLYKNSASDNSHRLDFFGRKK